MMALDILEAQKPPEQRVSWQQMSPKWQEAFRDLSRSILEMGISVIMADATKFVDEANGDMGGAYSKALRRYVRERLE